MTDALQAARERLMTDVEVWFAPVSAPGAMALALALLKRRVDDVIEAARLHDPASPF